eukprot:scaffold20447_cov200-Amphora_coffeaeformis.AAC.2
MKLSIAITMLITASLASEASAAQIIGWNLDNVIVDEAPYEIDESYASVVYDSVPTTGGTSYGGVIWVESDVKAPGMKVVTDGDGMDRDKSCIMTAGFEPNSLQPKQCNDDFMTSKRVKVYSDDLDGPVDLVYDISEANLTDDAYRFFLKYENLSDKRIKSFKLELGTGIGDAFVKSSTDDGLFFTARDGIALVPGDVFPLDSDLATLFAFGLFGDAETNADQDTDGYYDPANRGIFTMVVEDEDLINATMVSENIASLYGGAVESWIPKWIAPLGFFYDFDDDPSTESATVADFDASGQGWQNYRLCTDNITLNLLNNGFLNPTECRFNTSVGPVPISTATIEQWEASPLFEQGAIEDFGNVNVNTHIKVNDTFASLNSNFTIRITPTADDTATGAPWLPTFSDQPSTAPSVAPSVAPSDLPTLSTQPSAAPSDAPTASAPPSTAPSDQPSAAASDEPTLSLQPSAAPSHEPTSSPQPSESPSDAPTLSKQPSASPSEEPTVSAQPSALPSDEPTLSVNPSAAPSGEPTLSLQPSSAPTGSPTALPTMSSPTMFPTILPTAAPTVSPTKESKGGLRKGGLRKGGKASKSGKSSGSKGSASTKEMKSGKGTKTGGSKSSASTKEMKSVRGTDTSASKGGKESKSQKTGNE